MAFTTGERVGPYEIHELIGKGGMGEVYKARDTRLGRFVAIKTSRSQFSERFEREARAIAALNHPNICTLHDVGPNYLVMEFVEGESPCGPMPVEEALRVAHQIADALEAAHDKGITHRDLKPANIKVRPDGSVKVLDFGLAKLAGAAPEQRPDAEHTPTLSLGASPNRATQVGTVLGTPAYMAPEQAKAKEDVDKRADIWAFGVVLHELISGKQLFRGDDLGDTLAAVIMKEPDLSGAPANVRSVLKACLEKDPRKRLRDIGDVWRLLEQAPAEPAALTPPPSPREWLWPALTGLFVVSTAALGLVHLRETPPAAADVMRFELASPAKTTYAGFAISPDGRRLAFVAVGADGRLRLWVRQMDQLEARELPMADGINTAITWSPDSRMIGFTANGKIYKIDASGGSPQIVCDCSVGVPGLAWSPDGVILFNSSGVLSRVSENGGAPAIVSKLDAQVKETGRGIASFLPDGKHYFYFLLSSQPEYTGAYIGSLDAKPGESVGKRLLDTNAGAVFVPAKGTPGGFVLFLRGQALMAQAFDPAKLELSGEPMRLAEPVGVNGSYGGLFSASGTGVLVHGILGGENRQLTWLDRQGKILGHVGTPVRRDEMALSPDGTRVVEGRLDAQGNWVIWLEDLVRGGSTRFTFDGGGGNGTWSPDGSLIAYAPTGGQSADIYRKVSNGAGKPELLVHSEEIKTPMDWSRDGRFLMFTQRGKDTGPDLWTLADPGKGGDGKKAVPYLATQFNEGQGQFSPDVKMVAYTSNESGNREVYVQTFPDASQGKWLVSNGGGSQPRWRRDGKELFYFSPDGSLMAVDVSTTPTFKAGVAKALFRVPVVGGAGGGPSVAWRWDISLDGQRFLVNTSYDEGAAVPVTVVTNWTGLLKK